MRSCDLAKCHSRWNVFKRNFFSLLRFTPCSDSLSRSGNLSVFLSLLTRADDAWISEEKLSWSPTLWATYFSNGWSFAWSVRRCIGSKAFKWRLTRSCYSGLSPCCLGCSSLCILHAASFLSLRSSIEDTPLYLFVKQMISRYQPFIDNDFTLDNSHVCIVNGSDTIASIWNAKPDFVMLFFFSK